MYKFLAKNGQLLGFGLGALIVAIFLASALSGIDQFSALAEDQRGTSNIFNFGLQAAIALVVIGAIAAILFGLFQMVSHPKGAIKGIIGIGLLIALFFVGQAVAGPDTQSILDTRAEFNVTDGQSSLINGSIMGALLLAGLTVLAFVFSEVRNFFK